MRVLLALLVLTSGCAAVKPSFVPDEKLKFDAARYPDDAAVVLFRADNTEVMVRTSGNLTRNTRREVTAVLGEGGFDVAEVRIPLWGTTQLVEFLARVVQPDGTQQTFDGAQLVTDTSGKGERDLNAKFFRFPDVRVGSILEYVWVSEAPYVYPADEQDTLGPFPVKHYEFELIASKPLVLGTIEFNGSNTIAIRQLGDGRHRVSFEFNDLPRRREAHFAPHWTFTEPRWAWRILGYKVPSFAAAWLRDWSDVVENRGKAFFVDGKLEDGLTEAPDFSGCSGVKCKVERSMALLAERTITHGVKWNREEKLAFALGSGKASVVERALLLKHFLAREGLDVWLAYGSGKISLQPNYDFPRLEQFDHLFVHLPVQPGVEQAVTIDAACDSCGYGQLPARFERTQVYVFKTKPLLGDEFTEGRWVVAMEEVAPATAFVVSHQAELRADGTVSDLMKVTTTGRLAAEHADRKRTSNEKKTRESEQRVFNVVSPLADVERVTWNECTTRACAWETEVSFPAEASADGKRWLVPTSVLRPLWEGKFESSTRDLDVHFVDEETVEELYALTVPAGLELVEVPKPLSVQLEGLQVEVSYSKTPRGVELKRKLSHGVGAFPKTDYAALRAAVETFRRARREVLVFEPKK